MHKLIVWSPRILGIAVAMFLAVFALDEFGPTGSFSIHAFLMHVTPSLFLLGAVALAWRWKWVGAIVFVATACYYAMTVWPRVDWAIFISGPLVIIGILFAWSWVRARRA